MGLAPNRGSRRRPQTWSPATPLVSTSNDFVPGFRVPPRCDDGCPARLLMSRRAPFLVPT